MEPQTAASRTHRWPLAAGTPLAIRLRLKKTIATLFTVLATLSISEAHADDVVSATGYICSLTVIPPGGGNDLGAHGHLGFSLAASPSCKQMLYRDLRVCTTGATDNAFCAVDYVDSEVGLQTMVRWIRELLLQRIKVRIEKPAFGLGVVSLSINAADL